MRSTHFWRFVACIAGALLLLLGAAYTLRRRPILFHVYADTGCACGEYHEDVTGLIVRNPFRDPLPEQSAAKFLKELREGRPNARQLDGSELLKLFPGGTVGNPAISS